ncbi:MAG: hypothetical protein ACTSY1_11210 [Alphaproteobacteria bacterium]
MRENYWIYVLLVGLGLLLAGPGAGAQTGLTCSGTELAQGPDAPKIFLRLEISIDQREIKKRWLGVSRYTNSFRDPKPEEILDTISRRGAIKLTPCDDPNWPARCTSLRPADRTLLVSQYAQDPLYFMGYMTCAFCQLSPMIVETNDDGGLEFRYFENNLVVGTCKGL